MTIRLFRDNAEGGYEKKRYKKAKSALCFARIAKAILGDVTLHNSNFLIIEN